jgi:hypothetical protein
VTTGITGCPAQALVVFDYVKASRTWSASCGEKLYVCSDGRGPARCTPQQDDTVDQERAVRAKALAQLSASQRAWFVDHDILQGDWPAFAQLVATLKVMNDQQLKSVNPALVYGGISAKLGQAVRACTNTNITFQVDKSGAVSVSFSKPCSVDIVNQPELAPLRARAGTTVVLLPGVYGVQPIPRPSLAAARPAPAVAAEPATNAAAASAAASAPASPELDSAVRQWLDKGSASVTACTGKNPTVLSVEVDATSQAHVSIRGVAAGAPEEGCVKNALGAPPALPAGPAQILHVLKSP